MNQLELTMICCTLLREHKPERERERVFKTAAKRKRATKELSRRLMYTERKNE